MITDGGNSVVTPAALAGYTTITFNDVGDSATLVFTNSNVGCSVARWLYISIRRESWLNVWAQMDYLCQKK